MSCGRVWHWQKLWVNISRPPDRGNKSKDDQLFTATVGGKNGEWATRNETEKNLYKKCNL